MNKMQWILFLSALYLATRYTWVAGIPGLEPVVVIALGFVWSWWFADWLAKKGGG